ncbi:MAG: DUF2065 domain-containing protein [Alphaproteobacteria bacterium]|nr:DUF2065 domain-containing protein [Alphaproteobacteria bacterium]
MNWSDLFDALGLLLVIEGLLYAAFPTGLRWVLARLLDQPEGSVRFAGLLTATVGLVVVWLVRGA